MDGGNTYSRGKRLRAVLVAGGAVTAVLAAGIVYLWYFTPPQTIDRPVELARGEDGEFPNVGASGDDTSGARISVHAGKLQSQNNMSTASSSSHSNPASFPSRSLMLLNLSDHLLMKRVGQGLLEALKEDPQLDRLEYYPLGHRPELGIESPDLFVTIDLESIEESGLVNRELKAKVKATLGTSLAASNHRMSDSFTPPVVHLNTKMRLDHHSTLTGVESSAAKYVQQGQDIAKTIAKAIQDTVKKQREDNPTQFNPPSSFYPPWSETPIFNFLEESQAERLSSVHGLMVHNETFWKLTSVADPTEAFVTIRDELRSAGWKGGGTDDTPPSKHMRLMKASKFLEVFEMESNSTIASASDQPIPEKDLIVRYRDRITAEELSAAMEELLAPGATDVEVLLNLRRYARGEQRDRILAMLEANPPDSATAWLALADVYAERKDVDAVAQALRRAHHLTYALTDYSDEKRKIKEIAKKHKLDVEELTTTDPSLLEEMGFVPVRPDRDPCHIDISPGQTAKFLLLDGEKDCLALVVKLGPSGGSANSPSYDLTVLRSGPNQGRSWSQSSGRNLNHPYEHGIDFHGHHVNLQMERQDDSMVRVTAGFADP